MASQDLLKWKQAISIQILSYLCWFIMVEEQGSVLRELSSLLSLWDTITIIMFVILCGLTINDQKASKRLSN